MLRFKYKNQTLLYCVGVLWGIAVPLVAGINLLRSNLIVEKEIPGTFGAVTANVPAAVKSVDGWTVTREQCQLPKTANGNPVLVFKLCNADYAKEMLDSGKSRKIAAAIPCSLAFYTKENGKLYAAKWNMPLVGRLLGGIHGFLFPGRIAEDLRIMMERISANREE